ncbi:MAG: hypothetical protein DRI89_13690 [Bacteroidetes bacterium]|nr:MAG: hypothetical protein DRI89_13690 [Bacteroidota bacterium]
MNNKGKKRNTGSQKPDRKEFSRKPKKFGFSKKRTPSKQPQSDNLIRINKYLADAGVCSRREADRLIESGVVKVNGEVITQLGTKISPSDKVQYGGQTLKREKLQYLLLNKPKGFITTVDDPQNRRTVMTLVENACKERIYPVGRLDRNTLGLLLFTNDGEMTKKLTHPKFGVKKIYHVFLDKNLKKEDLDKIAGGIQLEDGFIKPDSIAYATRENDKKQIGMELHSGRNRIVRRVFESLGYNVIKLDRVFFAGLTKKDLPRGKWRMLKEEEINLLKRLA